MDNTIRAFAEILNKYTKLHYECCAASPEECKEKMIMKFPLIQTTSMQMLIKRLSELPSDRSVVGKEIREYLNDKPIKEEE